MTADSEKNSPLYSRKRSYFGTGYRKIPPLKEKAKINGV
jgi:hypothetical protein